MVRIFAEGCRNSHSCRDRSDLAVCRSTRYRRFPRTVALSRLGALSPALNMPIACTEICGFLL
jgi:hypothetical protein